MPDTENHYAGGDVVTQPKLSYADKIRVEIETIDGQIRALEQKKTGLTAALAIVEDRPVPGKPKIAVRRGLPHFDPPSQG